MVDFISSNAPQRLPDWEEYLEKSAVNNSQKDITWLNLCFSTVDSTMDLAREFMPVLSENRAGLILAKEQLSGRGQQGRIWKSCPGAFYATFVFVAEKELSSLSGFSLAVSCAIADALEEYKCPFTFKWPNDLYTVNKEKFGGVLVEVVRQRGLSFVIIGIGINLIEHPDLASPDKSGTSSVFEISKVKLKPVEFADKVKPTLLKTWMKFLQEGFAPFKELWMKHAMFINEPIAVKTSHGVLKGIFNGVNEGGCLLLKDEYGIKDIFSGRIVME